MAPILAFTADEAWGYFPKRPGSPDCVHLAVFPEPGELTAGLPASARANTEKWERLMAVRGEVLKSLETAREAKLIGKATEANVAIEADAKSYDLLKEYEAQLPELFIVSRVELSNHAAEGVNVKIERAPGVKCGRCWKFKLDVGAMPAYPTICQTCADVVAAEYPQGF